MDVYFNNKDMMSLVIRCKKYQVQGTKDWILLCPSSILERLLLLLTPQEKNPGRYLYKVALQLLSA
jgi:hypothetical protein